MSTPAQNTTDLVLFARRADGVLAVLLIERGWEPFAGCWALPGGYLDPGETSEQAARRELAEETHLTPPPALALVGVYDTPGRDPRGQVISTAYTALLDHLPTPQAGDDARAAAWVPVPIALDRPLAFDHARILTDALGTLRAHDVLAPGT
ncbi:NUDIX hydrolase [Actinocrispum sp. NPDC049592]|uniref:NUDIX hydrolase n=1 Tax=Actinocrispum sp. NPDC049592 TaxID=3154835 RepID=UPI003428C365